MINCKITENYLKEKVRMIGGSCGGRCGACPLSYENNGNNIVCGELEHEYTSKAVALVQAWSDAHPIKTYLTDFLEKYPDAQLGVDGTPEGICPYNLGYEDVKPCHKHGMCHTCWNRELYYIEGDAVAAGTADE